MRVLFPATLGIWTLVAVLVPTVGGQTPSASPGGIETTGGEYRVGNRDVLDVVVVNHNDLSGKYVVAEDGTVAFPLLGHVQAAGRTTTELAANLSEKLADGYLRNPQVAVSVAEYRSQFIYVVGEVRTPGPVPLAGNLTLLEALAHAGSLTESAGAELLVVRPANDGQPTGPLLPGQPGAGDTLRVSLDDLQQGTISQTLSLRNGDTIFVPKGSQIFVLGQVKSPGAFPFSQQLTVFQAISLAGGATDLGSTGRVRVIRIVDGEKKELKVKLTDVLEPGDTVMVPSRWF